MGMLLLVVYDFITDVGMARQVWEMWVEYCTISFEIIFTDIDLDILPASTSLPLLKEDGLCGKIGHRVSWQ